MPRINDIAWTEQSQIRVISLICVLLDHEKYPNEQLMAEWKIGIHEPYQLKVLYTTKEILVELINGKKLYGEELETQKRHIQQAMVLLRELAILEDKRKVKVGALAKNLNFFLKLPSQDKEEIRRWLIENKWQVRLKTTPCILDKSYKSVSKNPEKDKTLKYQLKLNGKIKDMTVQDCDAISTVVRQISQDFTMTIVEIKEGCIAVVFEGSWEGFQRIEALFKSGEITQLSGFSIIEVSLVTTQSEPVESAEKRWVDLSQWLQRNVVEPFRNIIDSGWEYEPTLLGTYFALQELNPLVGDRSAFDAALSKSVGDSKTQDSQSTRLNQFIESLKKKNQDITFQFQAALELGESDPTPEIIAALVNRLPTIDVEETEENKEQIALNWQIALSLGKLDPYHSKAAVAQRKEIPITDDLSVQLLVAIKIRDDKDIDIFIQVYSNEEVYLPSDLKVVVLDELGEKIALDESGDNLLETHSHQEDCEIHLSFFASPSECFTVQLSLGDDDIHQENFVI